MASFYDQSYSLANTHTQIRLKQPSMRPRTFSSLVANDAEIKQKRTIRPSRAPLAPRTWSDLEVEDEEVSSCSASYPTTTTRAWRRSMQRPYPSMLQRAALNDELWANEQHHLLGIAIDCQHAVKGEDCSEADQCTAMPGLLPAQSSDCEVRSSLPLIEDPLFDTLSAPIVASATTSLPCLWADGQYPFIKPSREWLAHSRSSVCVCYAK